MYFFLTDILIHYAMHDTRLKGLKSKGGDRVSVVSSNSTLFGLSLRSVCTAMPVRNGTLTK